MVVQSLFPRLLHLSIFRKPTNTLFFLNPLNPKPALNPSSRPFTTLLRSTLVAPPSLEDDDADLLATAAAAAVAIPQIPADRLFVPPETEFPTGDAAALSARVLKGSNIVLSKYARDAQVVQAEFVKSSVRTEDCPSDGLPEFALVGRSNVGKSSLLNSLVRRKRLALISKKPGKTQCINHFRINDSWHLVDLPGYGYAAAPQELRTDWTKFTKDYFLNRSTLVGVFLLIDASIPAKKIDLEYASWLGQNQVHNYFIDGGRRRIL
ncbi:hypothetical protein BT93_L0805 [Corymbia citriodora subsp. variegata]|uniref:EngB-type G domain-containing protein n=1 Tax=Corymbia citriodora subsp. variegata TaxID=360336 RepID=A0A8T0CT22_CORYI|nr:hypothetical protein BT93_L0805 [Corymbia citriodora subsp. variegata]